MPPLVQDDSVLVVPAPGQPGLLFLRVAEGNEFCVGRSAAERAATRPAAGGAE
jgi:hypothetical protein